MVLTGDEIIEQVNLKTITIDPFDPELVGPNSYDVCLGNEIKIFTHKILDVRDPKSLEMHTHYLPESGKILEPGNPWLATITCRVGSKTFLPWLDGRSSIARLFVSVHQTAGRGDLGFGFTEDWTLEMSSRLPIRIYPGMRIAQFTFFATMGETTRQYEGRYKGISGPTASRYAEVVEKSAVAAKKEQLFVCRHEMDGVNRRCMHCHLNWDIVAMTMRETESMLPAVLADPKTCHHQEDKAGLFGYGSAGLTKEGEIK